MLLEVKNLSKKFNDNFILEDINFKINKGEVVVILGPSGAGKSTLLRCIDKLEPIDGGDILVEGKSILNDNINNEIGMVFQSYDLFNNMNIIDNITLAPIIVQKRKKEDVIEEARKLLKRVGLSDKEKAYPRELSGGQKQRVAIVRSVCMNPEIMLFDEVTAALDPVMVREVLDVILELANSGMTMLIVTHEMNFARAISDRVLLLDNKRIIEDTDTESFFENPKSEQGKAFLQSLDFMKRKKKD